MSPPSSIPNAIIRASAGSGKTHALVQRLVRLLALGVKPESIVALTFTRKAAGEFFARLLQRLADFVDQPEQAVEYTPELAGDTRAKCLRLLRLLLAQMDRMRLGTLDSFFAAMVQSLPFELGLTGVGALMSHEEERQAHEEVLDAVLVDLMRPEHSVARDELVEAWKLASLGNESSRPADEISGWMEGLHDWYLEQSDTAVWGDHNRIWTDKGAPIWRAGQDAAAVRKALEESIVLDAFKDKTAEGYWLSFYDDLEHHHPGTPLTKALKYMLEEKRGDHRLLARGQGVWKMGRGKEVSLSERASRALHAALQIVVGRELLAACTRTQGRGRLVGLYEKAYQRLVRSAGRLCFSDLSLLLSGRLDPGGSSDWQERWPQLRSDMEYRLDARYDHWLFDEFQDTSRRQWRVFENIVDEVLQDAEARRTFFAVGDLKQSIYLWREAEPELFLGVEERYRAHRMEFGSLRVSWRSTPEVLQMVNDTFGNEKALAEQLPGAMEWWRFEAHESAPRLRDQHGHSAFLSVAEKAQKEDAVVALLRQINPLGRGLSCAVLVRKNEVARALAVRLRADLACEVVCESEQAVATDNPVTLTLLSIIQLGAHPGDTLALQHLRMTPLDAWLDAHEMITAAAVGSEVRRELRKGGFLALAKTWGERLREAAGGLDAFSEWRIRQFLELAATFDASGSRDIDAFLCFARDHRAAGPGDSRALQVMTIHKSKGLEFDVVILPDLQVTVLDDARRQELLWDRDEEGELAWLLDKPASAIVDWDGRLTKDVERLEARAAFEGLCRLYVAMTRAKQGLYLLHHRDGRTAGRSEAGLVESVLSRDLANEGDGDDAAISYAVNDAPELTCVYETGTRDWYEQWPLRSVPPTTLVPDLGAGAGEAPLGDLLRKTGGVITRRTPSAEEQHVVRGRDLFSTRREMGRRMGVLVHGLFSEVPWLDGLTLDQVAAKWEGTRWAAMAGYEEAKEAVLLCLAKAEVKAWFLEFTTERAIDAPPVSIASARKRKGTAERDADQLSLFGSVEEAVVSPKPVSAQRTSSASREVWLERTFDLLLDGEWVSGQMDRVVVERNAQGLATSATILDFKTDAVTCAEERKDRAKGYAPQLKLYRQAVQRLTGLAAEKVGTVLVFTGTGEMEEVSI